MKATGKPSALFFGAIFLLLTLLFILKDCNMKIEDIQPKNKYWKTQSIGGGREGRQVQNVPVYVLEVDPVNRKVFASLNQAPAQWFTAHSFSRWTEQPQKNNNEQGHEGI